MTITATPSEIPYAGDGVSLAFPIPFPFDTSADIRVISTDSAGLPTELSTGFAITGGGGSTGTCTFTVAPALLTTITIFDDPELTQTADYEANDAFPEDSHEKALDRNTRLIKRQKQRTDRSLRVADGDLSSGDNLLVPITSVRAGKFMGFDAEGQPTALSGTGNDSAFRTDVASVVSGADGSALVGFRYPATGSRARSVRSRLVQYIDLLDFAAGDGATDDTAAIQAAVNACIADRKQLKVPPATYLWTGLVTVPRSVSGFTNFALLGDSPDRSIFKLTGTFAKALVLGDTAGQFIGGKIAGVRFDAYNGGVALATIQYGAYFARGEELNFEEVQFWGFSAAGVSNGFGYVNNYDRCWFAYGRAAGGGLGHGITTNTDYAGGGLNAININQCLMLSNDGFGARGSGTYIFNLDGNTIEQNKAGGILGNVGVATNAAKNYFEGNAVNGWTFASPAAVNVKADIILLGSGADTSMSSAFPTRGPLIQGCHTVPRAGQTCFVWNGGASDGRIANCTTFDPALPLLGEMHDNQYKGGGWRIENCKDFTTKRVLVNRVTAVNDTFAAYFDIDEPSLTALPPRNYALDDFNQWSVISDVASVDIFKRSTGGSAIYRFHQSDVWELVTVATGPSDIFGFAYNAADYPELIGKEMWWGIWVHIDDATRYIRPFCSVLTFNANPTAVGSWVFLAVSFTWPASGTVAFGVGKDGAATSGSGYVAAPLLCQVGVTAAKAMALLPKFRKEWLGTAPPAAGTWEDGDRVWNSAPAAAGVPGWICTTPGTPGTWKAMAAVAA